ncbi:MAG: biotin synthase BioB [Planctomycetota bacterium]
MIDLARLVAEAREARGLGRERARELLHAPAADDWAIVAAAAALREEHFGRRVRLHVLLNAKKGACQEDCGFCSQSAHHAPVTGIDAHEMLDTESIVQAARRASALGAYRFCIVTATRGPTTRDLDRLVPALERIRDELPVKVCCSLGLLESDAHADRLAGAGVDRFNHNLEAGPRGYAEVCTTHTWEERAETVARARRAGMGTCCGGIVGLEADHEDWLDWLFALRELDVDSVPVNFLDPRPGTPLAHRPKIAPREALRRLAIVRLVHPHREVRAAGGREVVLRSLQPLALAVANSIFTEGYLTTGGAGVDDDARMIEDAGYVVERPETARSHQPA